MSMPAGCRSRTCRAFESERYGVRCRRDYAGSKADLGVASLRAAKMPAYCALRKWPALPRHLDELRDAVAMRSARNRWN